MNDLQTQPHFHFRIVPFIVAVLLAFGLPYIATEVVDTARHYSHLVPGFADTPRWNYARNTVWLVLSVISIAIAVWVVPADYGLHRPAQKSYVLPSIVGGIVFGILLALVDYAPNIIAHTAPKLGYAIGSGKMLGWLGFNGLYAGLTEEVPFRALIVSYLAATMPGKWHVGRFAMNGGGVVAAAIWAFYMAGFLAVPLITSLLLFFLQFVFGVFLAYWLEKSTSILAPIIGHNVSGATEYGLVLLMVTLWA
jgi:hypothetical protein